MTIASGASIGSQNALNGIGLVASAVFMFALSDVLTKQLTMVHGVVLVVAVRYLVNVGLLAAIMGPSQGRTLWQTRRTGLVIVRGLCLAAMSLTMGLALRLMPVGETVAIVYLSPFLVMLLAGPLLGERVSLAGWIGAVAGFLGVLLIVRPGAGLDLLGVAFAVINALLATTYHLLTRVLARTETTIALLFHTAWVGAAVFCGLLWFQPSIEMPGLTDIGLMVLLGALATVGHFLFTAAYRLAPASLLAPVNYLHLVWAGALGWVVFDHMPDRVTLLGMAIVTAAGATVALRTHFARVRPII